MPAVETFKNVPELFEGNFEESIKSRTETMSTFKQLGPDDLVHVVKSIPNSRQQMKEVSSYHFVKGVDTSSSASIAAYINSLTYSLESNQKWFNLGPRNQSNSWNISKCTFCAFNAFSGMDTRVEARIPGGVKSFVVDVMGGRKGTDSEGWQETFLSSILRTLKLEEDETGSEIFMKSKRSLHGLFTLQTEMKFLELATKLFHKGRQLGSPNGPHLAGNHDNFLTLGIVGYFCSTGRPEISIGFLKPFVEKDPQLKGLMMTCLLQSNNQGLALKGISTFENVPFGDLADFLISREEYEKAEKFAIESLKFEPTNFLNWQRIVKIKISLKQVEKALIILNNAPMSNYSEGDFFKSIPKPVLISLPGLTVVDSTSSPTLTILEKLKSPNLKGTFKAAYDLLVEIYKEIGWDGLLESRSKVFVMEREYIKEANVEVEGVSAMRVSATVTTSVKGDSAEGADVSDSAKACTGVTVNSDLNRNTNSKASLKSPLNEPLSFPSLPSPHFLRSTGKKLCERWLDNLILILFEDLRIFSLYEEELKVKRENGKGAKEWLLLGKLSMRLKHTEEAKLAFQKCLFSSNQVDSYDFNKTQQIALTNLIQIYCQESRSQLALLCCLRLINCQEKVYTSALHPTTFSTNLCSLIGRIGMKRVRIDLKAIKGQQSSNETWNKLNSLLDFFHETKVHGYDY